MTDKTQGFLRVLENMGVEEVSKAVADGRWASESSTFRHAAAKEFIDRKSSEARSSREIESLDISKAALRTSQYALIFSMLAIMISIREIVLSFIFGS